MQIEYELNAQDYADYCRFHFGRSATTRRNIRILRWGFPVLWLALLAVMSGFGRRPLSVVDWLLVVFAVAWAAFLPRWMRNSTARRVRRVAEEGVARGLFGRHTLELSEDGVRDRTPYTDHLTRWAGLERVAESPQAVILYTGPNNGLPIPRRTFESDAAREAFVAEVARRITAGQPPAAT